MYVRACGPRENRDSLRRPGRRGFVQQCLTRSEQKLTARSACLYASLESSEASAGRAVCVRLRSGRGRSRTPSSAITNAKRMKVALMKFIVSNCLHSSERLDDIRSAIRFTGNPPGTDGCAWNRRMCLEQTDVPGTDGCAWNRRMCLEIDHRARRISALSLLRT